MTRADPDRSAEGISCGSGQVLATDTDKGLVADRKVHGVGDEAVSVGGFMQGHGLFVICRSFDGHLRMQHGLPEAAAAVGFFRHDRRGVILVFGHDNPCVGAEVEVPQHVATG